MSLATFTWLYSSSFELSDLKRETDGEDIGCACESNEDVSNHVKVARRDSRYSCFMAPKY